MAWWFNVDSKQVESDDNRSQNANVMGPYDSQEEASRALEHAQENTDRWDAEDTFHVPNPAGPWLQRAAVSAFSSCSRWSSPGRSSSRR